MVDYDNYFDNEEKKNFNDNDENRDRVTIITRDHSERVNLRLGYTSLK